MNWSKMQSLSRFLSVAPCAALLLAGCASQARVAAAPAASAAGMPADTGPSVVVSPTEARIVVPLGYAPVGPWRWNQPTTPANQMEYEWAVEVPGREGTYRLGYATFRGGTSRPGSGDLRGLVREGGVQVMLQTQENGETVVRDTEIPLRVQIEPDRLVFLLRGRAAVERVFAQRPGQAT
ncbi:MAG TPA: hypothetical protein VF705_02310, partial [Longimicrobium sp.]